MDTSMCKENNDDEIFFGKMTIKEIKKILCTPGQSKKYDTGKKNDLDSSLRLIQTHSAPNLRSLAADSPFSSQQLGPPADDSFIQKENVISKLCSSTSSIKLDNTLEVIDFILNNGPNIKESKQDEMKSNKIVSPLKSSKNTPVKDIKQTESYVLGSPNYFTPYKPLCVYATPSASTSKTPVFKTPANPAAAKKTATPRGKSGKIHSYRHISSPIALYIRNSPQVPLVKDVRPKKELPRAISTPKATPVTKNKENIHLPSVAYKSAKTTKVIQIPDQDKLPQSKSAKNMTSSSPRPTVMRHENRKMNPIKQRLLSNQEHSFANLSCHQAEVSLCTEKTAFKSTNKH